MNQSTSAPSPTPDANPEAPNTVDADKVRKDLTDMLSKAGSKAPKQSPAHQPPSPTKH